MTDVNETHSTKELAQRFVEILGPDRPFFVLALIYGLGVSLLSLAVPISVQMLINTVAHTGLQAPLLVLSTTLFAVLLVSGLLSALRIHLMEIYGRRFYARLVSEISIRTLYARNIFFADANKGDLFNRYFDIMTVQRTVPALLVGGFAIVLQAGVGFVVVSLYHPMFLVFNLVLIAVLWLIWVFWGRASILSGIALSHAKYATAAWLENIGASNGFFKSENQFGSAFVQSDAYTARYIGEHKRHFRRTFAQTIALLVVYALASAALLGLGGWLVIDGQLTLGQLVAAELILSAIFASFAHFSSYLNSFYDLCAAIDELSLFYREPLERPQGDYSPPAGAVDLVFEHVRGDARGEQALLNVTIQAGERILASASTHGVQRLFVSLLKRHDVSHGGRVLLGGVDTEEIEIHALRRQIIVLDRHSVVGMKIRDYLSLAGEGKSAADIAEALEVVGLGAVIGALPDGLDTVMSGTGWPLSAIEVMELKLASSLLARPKVLVMTPLFDCVPENVIRRTTDSLNSKAASTVIYFSNRSTNPGFSRFLHLGLQDQTFLDSFAELRALTSAGLSPRTTTARLAAEQF